MRIVDLRSDTVTTLTDKMHLAMKKAEIGDDGFGEDRTTNKFEDLAAGRVGKEDALFVPSGVMGNLIAIMVHTKPGDGLICDRNAHINSMASGNTAAVAGITTCPLETDTVGNFDKEELESHINLDQISTPKTTLLVYENTNNLAGGTVVTPEAAYELSMISKKYGLRIHLDGARIFNSSVAQGVEVAELTRYCDSVMFCISKGLSSPVGSILAGSKDFITQARRFRKMLGGGMRQTGVLSACGIISLEEMVGRLGEDHDNARLLAEGLAKIDGFYIAMETVQTNIIRFTFNLPKLNCRKLIEDLERRGVRAIYFNGNFGRMVTHKEIKRADILYALEEVQNIVASHQR
ncbi:MAG: aminotransferase class I/II-fold pyridoxal phosphate-dependent enzyme [Candidatus Scalindua sp. AMX11]|nr:MAG: aminotransferase class I/II-fold pyridoxal phosphate-dependent enzyme [Candidatus Scalindua sp.]NOG82745.1 aminotransferase class I/II-fold pyridoxal phosphate-dependent enzyme [Planctomycetota bacterium]RZV95314.1 MAG: aminotransferase class I/II-fold pyridoxal phosphate-dependent enzyme [Candidatus Scalindua sp. SCAELEC01]TDE66203.1 MAG: aminotransferase class I/II-fold pyridoxal phosphate-dependent enzyme [Candidatus Scalindua sp. AMX11]GJQ57823.1 MAG: threonine aldolase [Candidatus 